MRKKLPGSLVRLFGTGVVLVILNASIAASQPQGKSDGVDYSFSTAYLIQAIADLNRGGKFSLSHYQFRWGATTSLSRAARLGFVIGYDYLDFDFSDAAAFAGLSPWNVVHRINLALPFIFRADQNWQIFITPSIDWTGESGAGFSKALRYGAAVYAAYRFGPAFSLGAGVGIFRGLEETNIFPFLTLYWKITEKWLLTNPFSAGPIGPAGLELIHSPDRNWEIGCGGAHRSNGFRLDDKGIAPGGIGRSSGLPAWLRVTRKFGRQFQLDCYGGVLLSGELRLEDRNGRKLIADDVEPALFWAFNFSARM